jgi:hypothetical protein
VSLQDFFREARASFLKEQRQAVDAERRSASHQSQRQQEESEILKDEVAVAQKSVRDAQATVRRACARISYLHEQLRERTWLQSWFVEWRDDVRWRKREHFLEAKADRWCVPYVLAAITGLRPSALLLPH